MSSAYEVGALIGTGLGLASSVLAPELTPYMAYAPEVVGHAFESVVKSATFRKVKDYSAGSARMPVYGSAPAPIYGSAPMPVYGSPPMPGWKPPISTNNSVHRIHHRRYKYFKRVRPYFPKIK